MQIELFDLTLPLLEPFAISGGVMHARRSLVVAIHDGEGHVGWGESPPFELPFYSDETLAGARHLLAQGAHPPPGRAVVASARRRPTRCSAPASAAIAFARAALDTAVWDLEACRRGTGLAALMAERLGVEPAASIPCGVALGIPADRSARYAAALDRRGGGQGISPDQDQGRARLGCRPGRRAAARRARGQRTPAHGGRQRRLRVAARTRRPCGPSTPPSCCTSSSRWRPRSWWATHGSRRTCARPLRGRDAPRCRAGPGRLIELDGPRVWNLKVHRVGGLTEACRIVRLGVESGASLWAGTMPESGLGSQAAIAAASLPGFVYPSDVEPSARWFGPAPTSSS